MTVKETFAYNVPIEYDDKIVLARTPGVFMKGAPYQTVGGRSCFRCVVVTKEAANFLESLGATKA